MKTQFLVAESDMGLAEIYRLFLEQAGYEVLATHDAPDRLQELQVVRPDILVLAECVCTSMCA
jgi:DNA-binding response OmpR family regulator